MQWPSPWLKPFFSFLFTAVVDTKHLCVWVKSLSLIYDLTLLYWCIIHVAVQISFSWFIRPFQLIWKFTSVINTVQLDRFNTLFHLYLKDKHGFEHSKVDIYYFPIKKILDGFLTNFDLSVEQSQAILFVDRQLSHQGRLQVVSTNRTEQLHRWSFSARQPITALQGLRRWVTWLAARSRNNFFLICYQSKLQIDVRLYI